MAKSITVRAFAKINWTLRVLGRRGDGYHELDTLFQSISLHDDLTITESSEFACAIDVPHVPSGEKNLALRAARAIALEESLPPVRIEITKRIPSGGGLGGGSSDAAAVLRAMPALFGVAPAAQKFHEIALSLGSDVPFFLIGGRARGTGRGEILTPLEDEQPVALLLLVPPEHSSTAETFRAYSGQRGEVNDLEPVVFARFPHFAGYRSLLLKCGAERAFMTGSGSTIVGAFDSAVRRDAAAVSIGSQVRYIAAETITRAQSLS